MSESAVKFKSELPQDITKDLAVAIQASRAREALHNFGPMAETLAGIFCMAYRAADQDGCTSTQCEVTAQSAVEAFLETLTR